MTGSLEMCAAGRAAVAYVHRGMRPVPIPHREKGPKILGWPELVLTRRNVGEYFGAGDMNVGVLLGEASGGLTDIDLDCREARVLAERFLPATGAIFGRSSSPRSHWLYTTDLARAGGPSTQGFRDPVDGGMLLEIRTGSGGGAQTMFPPSVHPSGEIVSWEAEGDAARIPDEVLVRLCSRLAAACLLARHWGEPGGRNEHRMALAGCLLRSGWTAEETAVFLGAVTAVAGGAEEHAARLAEAMSAQARLEHGGTIYGIPKLQELVGASVFRAAAEWLGLEPCGSLPDATVEMDLSEDGVAREFSRRYGATTRFDHDVGKWFIWHEGRWVNDTTKIVRNWCRELARELSARAEAGYRQRLRKAAFANAVENLVRVDPAHAVTRDLWDQNPFLLGVPGGTIDLRTGNLRPAEPADYITKLAAVLPSDTASCPVWLNFLSEATGGDAGMMRFLQQWCGYCLTGVTSEHALLFIHGPGGNGKSVFLNTVLRVLDDYAEVTDMGTLTFTKQERHTADLAKLQGARLVTASETEGGQRWAESRIKQLTGGDPISARFMRQDWFTFQPQFKLMIAGNHRPNLASIDEAMRRRLNLVPFVHRPPSPDPDLEVRLREEWPAILRWMIDGCLDWQTHRLIRPPTVLAATAGYFDEQDLFGQWLGDECDLYPGDEYRRETSADLYMRWELYARAAGEDPGSRKNFGAELARRGVQPYRSGRSRGYTGIQVKREARHDPRVPTDDG